MHRLRHAGRQPQPSETPVSKNRRGSTFINILVRRRMETAQALLLTTDLQIQEIARRCGYTDQHYFSYCFKKYSGTSPVALRRARAAGEARCVKRPPRTVVLAAALISGVAVAAPILCTTLFLRSYRSAVVEGARTNSAQVVSQVEARWITTSTRWTAPSASVLEQLDSEPAMRDAFLNAFLTARPEVAAITTYDENGSLLDCWAQAGRTPKSDILRNLSFDLTTARRLGHGYISTPHVSRSLTATTRGRLGHPRCAGGRRQQPLACGRFELQGVGRNDQQRQHRSARLLLPDG